MCYTCKLILTLHLFLLVYQSNTKQTQTWLILLLKVYQLTVMLILFVFAQSGLSQVSKISLVDLAGSERADSSGAKGMRLKVSVWS